VDIGARKPLEEKKEKWKVVREEEGRCRDGENDGWARCALTENKG
jgi:hypothetical protein